MESAFLIYGLFDPRNDELRYVGKSMSGLKRPKGHFYPSQLRGHNKRVNWIKSLQAKGLRPEIVILEEVVNAETLPTLEKLAIAHYRSMGFDLVNGTDGGEGCPGRTLSVEARQKIAKAMSSRTISDATRLQMSQGQRERYEKFPETKEHIAKRMVGLLSRSPEKIQEDHLKAAQATTEYNLKHEWTEASRKRLSDTKKRLGQRPPIFKGKKAKES